MATDTNERLRPKVVVVEASTPEHFAAFRDLNLQWIDKLFEREPKDMEVLCNPVEKIISPGGQVFVALHENEPVGVCAMMPTGTPNEFELIKMGVREDIRGLGIGRALIEGSEAWCRKMGAVRLIIITSSKLKPALRLYDSSGYKVIHSGPMECYKRADLLLEKLLSTETPNNNSPSPATPPS